MDSSTVKDSGFPPSSEVPLQRNAPLAPSQELAYRNKCIQLKRRLHEIEANNDATRKRIAGEKERVQKMRFLRAILLNQLKDIMSTSGKKLTPEQLSKLGITETAELEETAIRPDGETLLDDSSDESEDEEVPEPSERPTRIRRTQNNNYRENVMNTSSQAPIAAASYAQTGLPNLAPATAYSPPATRESAAHVSSYHVGSTPLAAAVSPSYSHSGQHYQNDARYAPNSSPLQQHQTLYKDPQRSGAPHESNGVAPISPPIRPDPPFVQFQNHMRPQLEADNYPTDQVDSRIDEEWKKLSDENRGLWEQRYHDQMSEYQQEVDSYNRARRRGGEYR